MRLPRPFGLNFEPTNAEATAMANISRPFQVALAGVVVLAAVWLFALRGHNNSSESTSSTPAASAAAASSGSAPSSSSATASTTPAAEEKAAAAKTPVYHGAAPGVQGLSSAIAKAHGAVAASQANAHQLESKSAQASTAGGTAASAPSAAAASAPAASAAATAAGSKAAGTSSATHPASLLSAPARQRAVEKAIARGDVTLILFWDRRGADDLADAKAVRLVSGGHSHVSVQLASAKEVADFGTITRGVQVYGTPTVLVVGKSGQATVLTGLTDRFALAQAIEEARHA
jgi:hypothetical protein